MEDSSISDCRRNSMAQTGTQQTQNVCSKCGRTFDSAQQLSEHQANCKGPGASAGSSAATPEKPQRKSREEVMSDMRSEEAFEAEDN
jgi:hypothetical protein